MLLLINKYYFLLLVAAVGLWGDMLGGVLWRFHPISRTPSPGGARYSREWREAAQTQELSLLFIHVRISKLNTNCTMKCLASALWHYTYLAHFSMFRYKLLCSCWYEQYEERPTFSAIVQGLEHFLEVTSDYLDLAAVSTGTIDTDDHASRLSSEAEEITSLPDSGSNKNSLNRHSILDRVISSPNEYAEAGSF